MTPSPPAEHLDVLIVGAGLSGIGAAYHLQTDCPTKRYVILEGRAALGGTWDLFRYPGVRSDSDMYTLGYNFRPWRDPKAIADGSSILNYIRETAEENGIDKHIRYQHRVTRAVWSSAEARWTVQVSKGAEGDVAHFTCNFLYLCTGYYNYDSGYTPEWQGMERFAGQMIHPQKWPEELDYTGKRIVVIGSGATAVTLVPALTDKAAHVTMLQRSPTYIASQPSEDKVANTLRRYLTPRTAYSLTRWKNVLVSMLLFGLARRKPEYTKGMLLKGVREGLGADYDIDKHFTPRYNPWDQRVCLVPDADLFEAIKSGKASVVTDHIETFTETGLQLRSGEQLEADLIVTATGLRMQFLSGMSLVVDGKEVELNQTLVYKGMMYSDVPNLATAFGYTNASWTLKCDLTAAYVCRLLNHMDGHGYQQCTPRINDPAVTEEPVINFTSGYVQRALETLPQQGSKKPWKLHQNYALDLLDLRLGNVDDGTMVFGRLEQQ